MTYRRTWVVSVGNKCCKQVWITSTIKGYSFQKNLNRAWQILPPWTPSKFESSVKYYNIILKVIRFQKMERNQRRLWIQWRASSSNNCFRTCIYKIDRPEAMLEEEKEKDKGWSNESISMVGAGYKSSFSNYLWSESVIQHLPSSKLLQAY